MAKTKYQEIPEPSIKRLAAYIHLLINLRERGYERVSSTLIADELVLDPTQVRKDIQYTKIVGRPKTGFDVDDLIESIEECLNWNDRNIAFLVGVGHLGKALLGYSGFERYGLEFLYAFDNNPDLVGTEVNGVKIFHIDDMPKITSRLENAIGVVAAPADKAQRISDLMVTCGIVGIWNFAPIKLKVPEPVIVENILLSQSLAVLTRKLSSLRKRRGK